MFYGRDIATTTATATRWGRSAIRRRWNQAGLRAGRKWDVIGPQIALVMAGGGATWQESHLVPVTRRGAREDVWWTYGYSPIEDSGGVQGVLVVCNDVSAEQHDKAELLRLNLELAAQIRRREEVELRQTFRLELADRLRGLSAAGDIARTATELLGRHLQVAQRQPDAPAVQFYVDLVCQPMRAADGSVCGNFITGVDVTERRCTRLALRASEERFRGAFENASLGMVMAGMDGRWTKVNRSFCAMLGYSETQLCAKSFHDLTHPDDVQASRAQTEQLQHGAIPQFYLEKRYLHRAGHTVWTILSVTVVHDAQGDARQLFATIENISARKQGEAPA